MYFGVLKLNIQYEASPTELRRHVQSLCQKLRARFKIVVCPFECVDSLDIAITALDLQEPRIHALFHDIAVYCENQGFGRVLSEESFVEHIDALEFAEP